MTDDPYADLVARLTGADPDRLLPVDALRLYDSDQATFPLSAEDAEGVLDVIDEAADAILKLQGEVAEAYAGSDRLLAAQNAIVLEVWTVLGGQDDTREGGSNLVTRVTELTTRLEAAEAEVARMRSALEPFAKCSEVYPNAVADANIGFGAVHDPRCPLTIGDFHRARALVQPGERT